MKSTILIALMTTAILAGTINRTTIARDNVLVSSANIFQPGPSQQQARGDRVTEEFHQSYPLAPNGHVSVENINGGVRIAAWDQSEVRVDAIKSAGNRERLAEANIEVISTADRVRIKTKYPERDTSVRQRPADSQDYRGSVEFVLTIPRKARVDTAELVNGSLEIVGVEGEIQAACVNGKLTARALRGDVKLSNVNGTVELSLATLDDSRAVTLNSVNGNIVLIIPADSNAEIRANTLHGAITNEFGLTVNNGQTAGHYLSGQLGSGGARVHLSNVNGQIAIKRG